MPTLMPMSAPDFDPDLLSRIEDAGINASAPTEQRWVDGWLVRFSQLKARRSRCINAVAIGRLPLAVRLGHCAQIYRDAGLPLIVRVTRFTLPIDLDDQLDAIGMHRMDDTRVMVRTRLDETTPAPLPDGHRMAELGPSDFAELTGKWQGASGASRVAQTRRLEASAVPFRSLAIVDARGHPVAWGQSFNEAELVGIYGVFTSPPHRGKGLCTALCSRLIDCARAQDARVAYLQVEATNHAARRIYERLGFADGYGYHYRSPDPHAR